MKKSEKDILYAILEDGDGSYSRSQFPKYYVWYWNELYIVDHVVTIPFGAVGYPGKNISEILKTLGLQHYSQGIVSHSSDNTTHMLWYMDTCLTTWAAMTISYLRRDYSRKLIKGKKLPKENKAKFFEKLKRKLDQMDLNADDN